MIANFFIILIFNWFIVTILWIYSQYSKKADIIDTYWGPSFFFVCMILLLNENNFTLINFITSIIVFVWSLRLMVYLHLRNHNELICFFEQFSENKIIQQEQLNL